MALLLVLPTNLPDKEATRQEVCQAPATKLKQQQKVQQQKPKVQSTQTLLCNSLVTVIAHSALKGGWGENGGGGLYPHGILEVIEGQSQFLDARNAKEASAASQCQHQPVILHSLPICQSDGAA